MSVELEEATIKVNEFQKQCEEYLVVIVQQKRDADEQQKVFITSHIVLTKILDITAVLSPNVHGLIPDIM